MVTSKLEIYGGDPEFSGTVSLFMNLREAKELLEFIDCHGDDTIPEGPVTSSLRSVLNRLKD